MERTYGSGVYVKSLFQLLALLQIPQRAVCQHLRVSPTFVSLMAKGHKPMPTKHLAAFEAFVWGALRDKTDAYWDAIAAVTGEDGPGYDLGDAAHEPLLFKPPPDDAPPIVHQWWAFHVKSLELMDAWDLEVNPEPQCREAQRLCGQLCQYHLMDADKFAALFLSPQREELARAAEQLVQVARAVERANIDHITQRLRATLRPRARQPQATTAAPTRRR